MTKRKSGFYWVKAFYWYENPEWIIAKYMESNDGWFVANYSGYFCDSDFSEIDERQIKR